MPSSAAARVAFNASFTRAFFLLIDYGLSEAMLD
jgi:hypothetical protein